MTPELEAEWRMGAVELCAWMHNRHKGQNKYRSVRRIALCIKTADGFDPGVARWVIVEMVTGEATCRKFLRQLEYLKVPLLTTSQWPSNPYKIGGYFYHA
jgi:hypothetical protein